MSAGPSAKSTSSTAAGKLPVPESMDKYFQTYYPTEDRPALRARVWDTIKAIKSRYNPEHQLEDDDTSTEDGANTEDGSLVILDDTDVQEGSRPPKASDARDSEGSKRNRSDFAESKEPDPDDGECEGGPKGDDEGSKDDALANEDGLSTLTTQCLGSSSTAKVRQESGISLPIRRKEALAEIAEARRTLINRWLTGDLCADSDKRQAASVGVPGAAGYSFSTPTPLWSECSRPCSGECRMCAAGPAVAPFVRSGVPVGVQQPQDLSRLGFREPQPQQAQQQTKETQQTQQTPQTQKQTKETQQRKQQTWNRDTRRGAVSLPPSNGSFKQNNSYPWGDQAPPSLGGHQSLRAAYSATLAPEQYTPTPYSDLGHPSRTDQKPVYPQLGRGQAETRRLTILDLHKQLTELYPNKGIPSLGQSDVRPRNDDSERERYKQTRSETPGHHIMTRIGSVRIRQGANPSLSQQPPSQQPLSRQPPFRQHPSQHPLSQQTQPPSQHPLSLSQKLSSQQRLSKQPPSPQSPSPQSPSPQPPSPQPPSLRLRSPQTPLPQQKPQPQLSHYTSNLFAKYRLDMTRETALKETQKDVKRRSAELKRIASELERDRGWLAEEILKCARRKIVAGLGGNS